MPYRSWDALARTREMQDIALVTPTPEKYALTARGLLDAASFGDLASFLSISCDTSVAILAAGQDIDYPLFVAAVKKYLPYPWDHIFERRLGAQEALQTNDIVKALELYCQLVSMFVSSVFSDGTNVHLPVLYVLLEDLADLAITTDLKCKREGKPEEALLGCMQIFQSALAACLGDRTLSEHLSRRKGALKIVNIQMKILFQGDQTALISKLIDTLNHRLQHEDLMASFSLSEIVAYRFHFARNCILDDRNAEAEHWLTYAMSQLPLNPACSLPLAYERNQRHILNLLIPLKMCRGQLPSPILYSTFPKLKPVYEPISKAIASGSLDMFNNHVNRAEVAVYFRKYALFDIVVALKWLVYRRLFRKVFVSNDKSTRLHLDNCKAGLLVSLNGTQLSERECNMEALMCTMISMDLLRGYISHERQVMVLSAKNPFPAVKDQLFNTFALWDTWRRFA